MATKGILYYSHNEINADMLTTCQRYMQSSGLPITSVTLKSMDFGRNIVLPLERGYRAMYLQIQAGLEAMTEDIVYFCEHDTLYHPNHFEFTPENPEVYYYAGNYWFVRMTDGFAVHYDVSPLSGLVAYREPLLIHFKERNEFIKQKGFGYYIGFEPFTHHRIPWRQWYDFKVFIQKYPNVDLCHGENLTKKRWSTKSFIRKPKFWVEGDIWGIPGWPDLPKIISDFFPLENGQKVTLPT